MLKPLNPASKKSITNNYVSAYTFSNHKSKIETNIQSIYTKLKHEPSEMRGYYTGTIDDVSTTVAINTYTFVTGSSNPIGFSALSSEMPNFESHFARRVGWSEACPSSDPDPEAQVLGGLLNASFSRRPSLPSGAESLLALSLPGWRRRRRA